MQNRVGYDAGTVWKNRHACTVGSRADVGIGPYENSSFQCMRFSCSISHTIDALYNAAKPYMGTDALPSFGAVDIADYHPDVDEWTFMCLPVTVTHWMPLPEPPEEEQG